MTRSKARQRAPTRLSGKCLIQNFPHRKRDDDLPVLAEERVDFAQGVVGVVEADEAPRWGRRTRHEGTVAAGLCSVNGRYGCRRRRTRTVREHPTGASPAIGLPVASSPPSCLSAFLRFCVFAFCVSGFGCFHVSAREAITRHVIEVLLAGAESARLTFFDIRTRRPRQTPPPDPPVLRSLGLP